MVLVDRLGQVESHAGVGCDDSSDLLQITKLYTVFDVRDDEATAISSFTK